MKQALVQQMQDFLSEALRALTELERETQEMTLVRAEGVAACNQRRNEYYAQLREVMQRVEQCAAEDETGMLRLATRPDTSFADLPEALQKVFEQRQAMNAVICRILALEKQADGHIRLEQERLLAQIRENNVGQSAQASRFLGALQGGNDRLYFPQKPKQI